MKPFIQTILFFFIGIQYGLTQDSSILITAKMFDGEQKIALSAMNGWLFKEGNDSVWANRELNTGGWRELKPAELSAKFADKTGRVEGWFRFKFRLDNDFMNIPLFIGRGGWAATDVYINGNFLASFGNTSTDYKTYQEHNPGNELSIPAVLEPGTEHIIALHFVDYIAPLSFRLLRSATIGTHRSIRHGLHSLLILTGPKYNQNILKYKSEKLIYRSIWVSATIILALFFWLLLFQSPGEKKTFLLIAVYSSCAGLSNLTRLFLINPDISFLIYWKNDLIFKLCTWIIFVLTFIIAKRILNFKIAQSVKPFLIAFSVLGALCIFFNFFLKVFYLSMIASFFFYTYILISFRKKLTAAQWTIAAGLTISILFGVLFGIFNFGSYFNKYWQLLQTGIYFSFPLSLMVYVTLRFGEMIKEREEQMLKKQKMNKELLELEARALRAQMNPHFIFNSLNSIKSLIHKHENEKAAGYLTTFSKLIRTLFQNSDKREVSLLEELETCRLYAQLERMRFGDKVDFVFNVDERIDLKDIKVPALILQPFIENAIWHGLVPKETGGKVLVSVKQNNGAVECIIDDDGIGRELSAQHKAGYEATHQSKGIGLTQSRLELDNMLNDREDSIRVIDKKDENGMSSGTKVILTIKENKNDTSINY
jgi:sensor histidine kinase YesM